MAHERAAKYHQTFRQFGESPKSLQWANYRAAAIRYKALTAGLDFEGATILDAGCGMGDILPFIYARASNFDYLGVDPTPKFIETARKRYDGHHFEVADPFDEKVDDKELAASPSAGFDIVLCSGVLNDSSDDWLQRRKQMIARLYDLASKAVAFNMAGSFAKVVHSTNSRVAYADAQDIIDYCKTLTSKLEVRTNYHPKDFTVILYK